MNLCPKCNKEYDDNLTACPYCGGNADADAPESLVKIDVKPDVTLNESESEKASNPQALPVQPVDNSNGKKPMPTGVLVGIIAAIVVVIVVAIVAVFCISGNSDNKNNSSAASGTSSAVEDMTMPSGYEDVIKNIRDDSGHVITQATDPYGNTITREVDSDGNVTTTYVGPDGQISTVVTDGDGNIISYDVPTTPATSSKTDSSTSSKNNSSSNTSSKNNSSSSGNTSSANPSNGEVLINGKSYKVGDTVEFTATAEGINEAVAGFQFSIAYDENLLELDKDSIKLLDGACLVNIDKPGLILTNGISVSTGYNFSMPADFISCKFKVKDTTAKACDITVTPTEVLIGIGTNELVDVTNDVETSITVK
ncbi:MULTISPECIES: cohesin domain-containing protein [unclassified Ruminococcus]|uniref:cohesin domain-containing protein n=1 Tax=unclassified Ruminococcus TaxID=2608920 RepID=UPI00210A4CBE|nr:MULTISPECIES: cohesin domain-containing protein [unclassified Ruminococcus]MCQ4023280.1 hypothetical protein [Ruminococcus sp. zg-924]MCQ4115623.1 hypothetical protein [Ruminococcus sp. zg-921]